MKSNYISESCVGNNTIWHIQHPKFQAKVSKYGAHVLSFIPTGKSDLLWLSQSAVLDGTKAIRGGIPICWPWFGPANGVYQGEPQHGYARIINWDIKSVEESVDSLKIRLVPIIPDEIKPNVKFSAEIVLVFADSLDIQVISKNQSEETQILSQAIHTYLSVDNISTTYLSGLESTDYIDKLTTEVNRQIGDVVVGSHTDRVYITEEENFVVVDGHRKVLISANNHDSIVVWNPWHENAQAMLDFDDEGYLNMLCVEAANTQRLLVAPGQSHTLTQRINTTAQ